MTPLSSGTRCGTGGLCCCLRASNCHHHLDLPTPGRAGQVGSATVRLQEDAKSIKEALTALHSQHKSTQTSKILVDFEVTRPDAAAAATCAC